MRYLHLPVLLILVLFTFSSVQAQQLIPMSDVDRYIQPELEVQGFPTTGAQIEAVRQEISQNITDELNNVVRQIGELEGGNPVGREWLQEVEQAASANTPQTAREQFISYRDRPQIDSVTGADTRPVLPQVPEGIDREASDLVNRISDSLRDIFRSEAGALPTYQYTGQRPATGLQALVERYGKEVNRINGEFAWNEQKRRQFSEALADGTSDYIQNRIDRYRNVTQRVMRRYIQIMNATQDLPIAGYWRVENEVEYQRSGTCEVYVCDGCGGGVIPQPEEEDPGEPLCGYEGDPSFLVWRGAEHPYVEGTSSIYSAATSVDIEIARDSNGATIRNMRTEHSTEYEVVAPDRIIVRDTFREIGGCTLTAEYALVLVRQDETVCNIIELPPDEGQATPEPTPVPGEPRQLRVGQPLYTDPAECDATTTPPPLGEVTLTAQPDGSMLMDYGTGQVTLYSYGSGNYEFNTGTGVQLRQIISLSLRDNGTRGYLSWSNWSGGKNCYASLDLTLPGAEPDPVSTPAPTADSSSGNDSTSPEQTAALLPGLYHAEWINLPGLCHAALQPTAPQFAEVALALPDAQTLQADYEGGQYTLINGAPGMFFALTDSETISGAASITVMDAQSASFGWTVADKGDASKSCVVMATLTRIGD